MITSIISNYKYAKRNNFFFKKKILFWLITWIPSEHDIQIHEAWKEGKSQAEKERRELKREHDAKDRKGIRRVN